MSDRWRFLLNRIGERLGITNANQGPGSDGLPIFELAGYTGIGGGRADPTIRIENTFNPKLDVSLRRGKVHAKFGANVVRRPVCGSRSRLLRDGRQPKRLDRLAPLWTDRR